MSVLILHSGKRKGQRLRFGEMSKEIVVGHGEGCQIRLNLEGVSERHCALRSTADGLWVHDSGSETGTFVNNVRIAAETRLRPGDLLRLGTMEFQVAAETEDQRVSKAPAAESQSVTDDNIADWLSGGEHSEDSSDPAEQPVSRGDAKAKGDVPRPSRKFASVADEGKDIIRRWQEMQRENPKRTS